MDDFYKTRGEDIDILLLRKPDGALEFLQPGEQARITEGVLLSFCPATDTKDQPRGQGAKVSDGLSGPASPLPG